MADVDFNDMVQKGIDKMMNSRYAAGGAAVGERMAATGVQGLGQQLQAQTAANENLLKQNQTGIGSDIEQQKLNEEKWKNRLAVAPGASGIGGIGSKSPLLSGDLSAKIKAILEA